MSPKEHSYRSSVQQHLVPVFSVLVPSVSDLYTTQAVTYECSGPTRLQRALCRLCTAGRQHESQRVRGLRVDVLLAVASYSNAIRRDLLVMSAHQIVCRHAPAHLRYSCSKHYTSVVANPPSSTSVSTCLPAVTHYRILAFQRIQVIVRPFVRHRSWLACCPAAGSSTTAGPLPNDPKGCFLSYEC